MREVVLWIVICVLVAVAAFEGGYITGKKEDTWHDEGMYLNLRTRIQILEGEVFRLPSQRKK